LADTTHPLSPLLLQKEGETGVEFIRKNTLQANPTALRYRASQIKYVLFFLGARKLFSTFLFKEKLSFKKLQDKLRKAALKNNC
jgi:hypothetical protein